MQVKKRIEDPKDVKPGSASKVFLTITIGNAQIGGSTVQFKDEGEPKGKGKIEYLELGTPAGLTNRILEIETNVLDSNQAHDRIIFTHLFHDEHGNVIDSFQIQDKVDNHRDILSSLATYNFKS